jgi:uncharacterized protein YraI
MKKAEMANCLVIANHTRSYESPIIGTAGDAVKVGRRDDDSPGWIWCEHSVSGLAGWVPEAWLECGNEQVPILRRDYSAMELSVSVGQTLKICESVAGWTWCISTEGVSGWVPTQKLQIS